VNKTQQRSEYTEEHCSEPGPPARGDYVIVAGALSRVSQRMRTAIGGQPHLMSSLCRATAVLVAVDVSKALRIHCVSIKRIIDCNLKKDYQILNFFCSTILDTTEHHLTQILHPHFLGKAVQAK